ncbi:MAG TPA: hypothetical protein VI197_00390 [Polyangiaceae bacterium]
MREQLTRGAAFYGWTVTEGGPVCSDESFLGATADAALVRFRPDEWMFLHSGSFQTTRTLGQVHEFHGYSSASVLDAGHELFFSLEACRRGDMRYAPRRGSAAGQRLPDLGTSWLLSGDWRATLEHDFVSVSRRDERLLYQVRFYFDAGLVYLRGPLAGAAAPPGATPVARGVYRLAEGQAYLQMGGWRFCSEELEGESLARCLEAGARLGPPLYPVLDTAPPMADFAEEFWSYEAPLYVPVLGAAAVSCAPLERQASSHGLPVYRVNSEGLELSIALVRTVAGFDPFLAAPDTPSRFLHGKLSRSEPRFVVHGKNAKSFWINGSPWFLRQADCLKELPHAKPVNFGLAARAAARAAETHPPASPRVQRTSTLESEYYALESTCARVALTPLVDPMGRLVVERPGGSAAYDYDYYPIAGALWLSRIGSAPAQPSDPLAGRLLRVEPFGAGLQVGGAAWYATRAACEMALKEPPGGDAAK